MGRDKVFALIFVPFRLDKERWAKKNNVVCVRVRRRRVLSKCFQLVDSVVPASIFGEHVNDFAWAPQDGVGLRRFGVGSRSVSMYLLRSASRA